MKIIHVVAAVIEDGGSILCVQRGASKYPYIHQKWEFPGGKVEPNETPEAALRREIMEELGLDIQVTSRLIIVEHAYADFGLIMDTYRCLLADSLPRLDIHLTEHIAFQWMKPSSVEFASLDWAAADRPIVDVLRASFQNGT